MELFNTLQTLNASFGPSGDEGEIADLISRLAAPYADEVRTDVMGNVICHKRGTGPKVMFAAHMDSLGFVVTYIEQEGFLRVAALGGINAKRIIHTPVRFKNGVRGTVCADMGVETDKITMDDLYLDIGASSREEAEGLICLGDIAVYDTPVTNMNGFYISPYLDDRICCAVQLMAMEQLGETNNDLYFVFTTQEELGLRGARTAAYGIDPDFGIVLDVTGSNDTPKTKRTDSSVQGKGAAIKAMDHSVICDPKVVKLLIDLAQENEIPHQMTVKRTGGTDAGAMQPTRAGVRVGGICVPCRYTHSPTECIRASDALACVRLVCAFAKAKLEKE